MKRFCGVDVGVRNMAITTLHVEDGIIKKVLTELVDFGKGQTIHQILTSRVVHAYFDEVYDGTFIERQSNRSSKCFALMSALFVGFLRGRMIPTHTNKDITGTVKQNTEIVDPKNKFKQGKQLGLEVEENITEYKKRKKVAISMTRQICTTLGLADPTQGYRKKDDISDAFLYAFFGCIKHINLDKFTNNTMEIVNLDDK